MPSEDDYRRQADGLLRLAAATDNMRDRSRLIDEAMRWHNRALEARETEAAPVAGEADDTDEQRPHW